MSSEANSLGSRELDDLVDGSLALAARGGGPRVAKPAPRRIKAYDFRHPEKLSKEQLRGLQIIQQGVSGSLAAHFSARLRAPVESRLSALERGIYEEYVAQVGGSIVLMIDMNPLQGYAVASFGLDVAFGIIDRLLGGKGKQHARAHDRDLTDIEIALIRHIGQDIARSLVEPWARVADLQPEITELAVGPQIIHVIPASEFVITAWYELRYAGQVGGVSLCFPLNVIEQILPKLSGQSLFENRPGQNPATGGGVQEGQLLPMNVAVRAILGRAAVPASDIAALRPGDVIVLDSAAAAPLHVFVEECERFAASPGTRGRRMALQIAGMVDDDGWVIPFADESS